MPCRIRVALFVPSLTGGGAERVMVNLARGFAERGLAVDLVLVKAEGPYLCEVPPSVRVVELRAAKVSTSLPALARYLRRERPQALLSTLNTANMVAVLAKQIARVQTRVVVRQANTLSRASPGYIPKLIRVLVSYCYRWADGVVAVSEGVAKDLAVAARLSVERIHVCQNPIVTPELAALAKEPLCHPWFAPGEPPVILGVGGLRKVKDYATLIRAFELVHQQHPSRLVILGEGEERPKLEALIRDRGLEECASLPGFVTNPYAYMAKSAVLVLSSVSEGLPGVLVQALACGTPVIATDCENGPREILCGGRYGRLVPVADVGAVAGAVLDVLGTPRGAIPPEAITSYTQDAAVETYLRVLQVSPN